MSSVEELDELAYNRASQGVWTSFIAARFDEHGRSSGSLGRATRLRMAELELEYLRTSTAIAKQRRNAVTACGSLPSEILAVIFALAQETWKPKRVLPDYNDKKNKVRYVTGWMTVLHVSSSWRETALNSPQLWTKLECLDIHPQLMTRTLLSSRSMPLQARVCDSPVLYSARHSVSPAVAHGWLCAPVIRRAEKLVIAMKEGAFDSWIRALHTPAPALKELEVEVFGWNPAPWRLEDTIFGGEGLPMLTMLSLTGCILVWDSPLLSSNLTKLRLSLHHVRLDEVDVELPTMSQFKRMLSPMTSLTELYLHNFFPTDDNQAEPPLALPVTLKTFECTSDDWTAFNEYHHNLWSCVKVPHGATVIFEVLIDEFEELLDGIAGDLFMPLLDVDNTAHPVRELCLSTSTVSLYYSIQARSGWTWRWPDEPRRPGARSVDRANLLYAREVGSRHVIAWTPMPDILDQLPLETLQAVHFSSDVMHHYDTPAKWLDTFTRACYMERIAIPYLNSLDLLSALALQADGDQFSLFPRLQVVVIHPGSQYAENSSAYHAAIDLSLAQLIEARQTGGALIRELLVDGAMASWDIWARIRESAPVHFFDCHNLSL
ncbi:hypothetical protein PENSPDRAFT_755982 [Peniophora sp. CONT]|nr:hypothetical protein PENSPDRAFT_755982 [Peniophora sp. CONT]